MCTGFTELLHIKMEIVAYADMKKKTLDKKQKQQIRLKKKNVYNIN